MRLPVQAMKFKCGLTFSVRLRHRILICLIALPGVHCMEKALSILRCLVIREMKPMLRSIPSVRFIIQATKNSLPEFIHSFNRLHWHPKIWTWFWSANVVMPTLIIGRRIFQSSRSAQLLLDYLNILVENFQQLRRLRCGSGPGLFKPSKFPALSWMKVPGPWEMFLFIIRILGIITPWFCCAHAEV